MLIAAALIGGAYAGCCRQRERTADYALVQIARAVQTEDRALFEQYVDTEAVLAGMHEDAAALIADNIDALHERHPSDWFFRHDAAFLRAYMAERRTADIAFARMMLDYAADPVRVQEGRAEADCIVRGNETTYGQLLPEASVTLELTRQADGRYRLTRVRTDARRPNGFFAVIDAAERYWELQGWD